MTSTPRPPHLQGLYDNFAEVKQLTDIHTQLTGSQRGRRFGTDVLNASGVVLAVACWESFVEDLASLAFDFLLANAVDATVIPGKVLVLASKSLTESADRRAVWQLAGSGWKTILQQHRHTILAQHLGGFNTPRQGKVDALFEDLLGLKHLSKCWAWHKNTNADVVGKLDKLITLRGQIAHRVTADRYVQKSDVLAAKELILRLAVVSSNATSMYLQGITSQLPWVQTVYGSAA